MSWIERTRRRGHAEHFSEAYFNRDKEREYAFSLLEDGTVIGWTRSFPDGCPSDPCTEHFIVPAGAVAPANLGELRRYAVNETTHRIAKEAGKIAETCPTCGHALDIVTL